MATNKTSNLYTIPQQRRLPLSRIAELALKTSRTNHTPEETRLAESRMLGHAPVKRRPRRKPSSTFLVLGPLPTQMIELSSSSESGYTSDGPPSSPDSLPRSTNLPNSFPHLVLPRSASAPPDSSAEKQSAQAQESQASAPRSKMDWVEYEKPVDELANAHVNVSGSESDEDVEGALDLISGCRKRRRSRQDQSNDILSLTDLLTKHLIASPKAAARQNVVSELTARPVDVKDLFSPTTSQPSPSSHGIWKSHRVNVRVPAPPRPLVIPESGPLTPVDEEILTPPNPVECDACGRLSGEEMSLMLPCQDLLCGACFSSSLCAVSVTHGTSKCGACLRAVTSFERIRQGRASWPSRDTTNRAEAALESEGKSSGQDPNGHSVVMRIDNVAWDITPAVVVSFLPPDSLSTQHPHPIHILLDRYDGRTKDYMYVEVASADVARSILQEKQNTLMPAGPLRTGRKRPVTISLVHPQELITELRPKSRAELQSLLDLCQAAVAPSPKGFTSYGVGNPYVGSSGLSHFVKFRHGPYLALMSIMSKMGGRNAPAYWDVLGAMRALAHAINSSAYAYIDSAGVTNTQADDQAVLNKLSSMFQACFVSPSPSPAAC